MLVALLASMAVTAMPAQARLTEPRAGTLPSADAEVTVVGTGAEASVGGGLPPLGQPFDVSSYPADIPAGYETELASFAGIFLTRDADGNIQQAYCIQFREGVFPNLGYQSGSWTEANVPNIGYVTRILNGYYPQQPGLPAEAASDGDRAGAVQAAIWFFTDGFVLRETDRLRPLVQGIVDSVLAAGPLTEPPAPDITIAPPSAAVPVGELAGPFTVSAGGAPEISVTVPTPYVLYEDAGGTVPLVSPVASGTQFWVQNPAQNTDPATISARAVVTVQRGTVYLYTGNNPNLPTAQSLILAANAPVESLAEATAEFFVAGNLTVNKTFAGEGAGIQGAITLAVDCGPAGQFVFDIPAGAAAPLTETVSGLPVGTVCSVTEPVTGSTSAVTVTPVLPDPVTITDGENLLAVTNTVGFNPGSLLVTKTITGTGAGLQDEIVIQVQCGDGIVDEAFVLGVGTTAGEYTQLYEGIPAGTLCTVSESASGGNEDVTVESVLTGAVTIQPGATQAAGVTNLYAPVPVSERLPKTGAQSASLALMGGGAVVAGSALVLVSLRRRRG